MNKVYPLPEALPEEEGKGWNIQEAISTPLVDLKTKQMFVPLGASDIDRCVRAHEQGHARWSPKTNPGPKHGIDPFIVNAVEDCRINTHLTQIGVKMGNLAPIEQLIAGLQQRIKEQDIRNGICGLLGVLGTESAHVLLNHAPAEWYPIVATASDMVRKNQKRNEIPSITNVIKAAKWLQDIFATAEAKQEQIEKQKKAEALGGMDKELAAMPSSAELEQMLKEMLQRAPYETKEADEWGDMVIETPARTVSYSNEILGRKRRPYQEGCVLRYPHRMAIDGAVFNLERSYPGASILLDGSGSMCWSERDLEKIVHVAPAALIAVYDGWNRSYRWKVNPKTGISHGKNPWGILRVLVAGGRRVPDSLLRHAAGGENIIDFPALVWLSKQPGPRYWISDGHVTGVSYNLNRANYQQCERLMAQYNIRRIEDMDETIRFFTTLKKRKA